MAGGETAGVLEQIGGAKRRHPKVFLFGSFTIVSFFILWLVLAIGDIQAYQPWIETLNGATWPSNANEVWAAHRISFAGAVALRTTVNFGVAINVVVAVVWFFFGGLERYMNINRTEMLRLFTTELVAGLVSALQKEGHKITEAQETTLLATADGIAKRFAQGIENVEDAPRESSRS